MIKMLIKIEVEDFSKWKMEFMAAEGIRMAAGSTGSQVFQNADNPKSVVVITEWKDMGKAKSFSESSALREAQQKSGVISKPESYVLESV